MLKLWREISCPSRARTWTLLIQSRQRECAPLSRFTLKAAETPANEGRSSHENSHDSAPLALSGRPDLLDEMEAAVLMAGMAVGRTVRVWK